MADPTTTDAAKYKVIFENERVRGDSGVRSCNRASVQDLTPKFLLDVVAMSEKVAHRLGRA